jgi:hypothetical protein
MAPAQSCGRDERQSSHLFLIQSISEQRSLSMQPLLPWTKSPPPLRRLVSAATHSPADLARITRASHRVHVCPGSRHLRVHVCSVAPASASRQLMERGGAKDAPAILPCMSWNSATFWPNCSRSCVYLMA